MKVLRFRMLAFVLGFALSVLGIVGAVAAPAMAVGAAVERADGSGGEAGTVVGVGNTNPDCCCAWAGNGHVGFGVKVCYLPA